MRRVASSWWRCGRDVQEQQVREMEITEKLIGEEKLEVGAEAQVGLA